MTFIIYTLMGTNFSKEPIKDITPYYTWKIVEKLWKKYYILDSEALIGKFWDDEHATWGKKTAPTYVRKAKPRETIITYVKDEGGEIVQESTITAREGQYILQNINDEHDMYILQENERIKEYAPVDEWDSIWDDFKLFTRETKPSKLLLEIIKKPTVITIQSWWDIQQFLEEWATLKLKTRWEKYGIVWINKGGFETRSLTDKDGNIL